MSAMKLILTLAVFIFGVVVVGADSTDLLGTSTHLSQVPQSQSALAAEPTLQEKIAFRRKTLHTMGDELGQVAVDVKAERFASAQATFTKALKKWHTFGGTIKRIAPESYAKIAPGFAAVKKGLYQSEVPLSQLNADLQSLTKEVKVALPISDATE
jgi:hypothetical protein